MKAVFFTTAFLLLFCSCDQRSYLQSDTVQLSKPAVDADDYFFTSTTEVKVGKTQDGSSVHYTTDGATPTLTSPVAAAPLVVDESRTLTFRTIGPGFLPSEPVEVEVLKLPVRSLTLVSATPANPPYNKAPEAALTDRAKAGMNFQKTDWLGYKDSLLTFEFSLSGGPVNGIALSVLEDQNSWIFAPKAVKATFYDAAGKEVASGQMEYPAAVEKSGRNFRFLRVHTEEVLAARVLIQVENLGVIPGWHSGAGSRGWVFFDEVFGL